jgi:hypothetical protein
MRRLEALEYAKSVLTAARQRRADDPYWEGYFGADAPGEGVDDVLRTLDKAIREARRRRYRRR